MYFIVILSLEMSELEAEKLQLEKNIKELQVSSTHKLPLTNFFFL